MACNRSGNVYLSLDRMNMMTTGPSFHACGNAERSRRVGGRRVRRPSWRARPGDPGAHTVEADDRSRAAWRLRQRRGRPAHRAARCGSPDRYATSWTARPAAADRQALRWRILGVVTGPAEPLTGA